MGLKNLSDTVGVIGGGSFGTAVSNILAENGSKVLIYIRNPKKAIKAATERTSAGQKLHENIEIVNELGAVAQRCEVIFPMVPSANFREMIVALSPYLRPYHILIHGTKGLDIYVPNKQKISKENPLTNEHIKTITEVITEESSVLRVGCMAGPNLARELDKRMPAATVIASHYDEVIQIGQKLLKNNRFLIFGSKDLKGIELCGVLKNIIAVGAGAIHGMGLGENAKSLFISRGLVEMIYIGNSLGGNTKAFLGLAGVGDLIATCTSPLSRNFTVGNRLAKGEKLNEIIEDMEEVAEGVKTINIIKQLSETHDKRYPITETLYKILHEQMTIEQAHTYLMNFPFASEIEFLEEVEEEKNIF